MKGKSTSIQYAYALNEEGTITHISEARRSHNYTCPGCRKPLTPVMGEINARHFRHSDECCAFETYLHKSAKEAFVHRFMQAVAFKKPISLELERLVFCRGERLHLAGDASLKCVKKVPARYNLTHIFNQAELELHDKLTGLRPDVMISHSSGTRRCYVEIFVTHSCSQEKIDTGVPILEFKVASIADIERILIGSYSIQDDSLRVFNWTPPERSVNTCSGDCSLKDLDIAVWELSESGRLNKQNIPLTEVDTTIHSTTNAWPNTLPIDAFTENLRAFIRHSDTLRAFPNCVLCEHSGLWENGYLQCRSKTMKVPYTEARQCAVFKERS